MCILIYFMKLQRYNAPAHKLWKFTAFEKLMKFKNLEIMII